METSGLLLRRAPSLERDLVVERESLPDKGGDAREGKTKQGETERLDKTQRRERTWRGPVDDTGSMEQQHAYGTNCEHEQEEKQNGRWRETKIEEQISLFPVRHAGRRRTKRGSAQTTGCIREDCAARDKERDACFGAEDEPACTRTKRKTQEPGGTHHRKSKENRKQDGSNGGSHPTDAKDAAENRDDVPAILGESPRRGWWEVENGHVVDQLMDGKTKTKEHTQLQGTRRDAVTNSARGKKTNSRKSRNVHTTSKECRWCDCRKSTKYTVNIPTAECTELLGGVDYYASSCAWWGKK